MHEFNASEIAHTLRQLQLFHAHASSIKSLSNAQDIETAKALKQLLATGRQVCSEAGFDGADRKLEHIEINLADGSGYNASALEIEARHAIEAIVLELHDHRFLRVAKNRASLLENPPLLGTEVANAFPSSVPDAREAGNCLAADCNTAAVFHLMRAVEWGLRALAANLGFKRVKGKIKRSGRIVYVPVEYSEWERILDEMQQRVDNKIQKLKRGAEKQRLQEFYYPALQDIRGLRDAWRNHVMHSRAEYTDKDADAVLSHVRRLMSNLAMHISEV